MFSTKEEFIQHQEKSIQELQDLSRRLEELPKKLNDYGLQKLNSVCFVPAKIYHTNEILVHLGNDYFVERTSFQAKDIALRRIKIYEKALNEVKGQTKNQNQNKSNNKIIEIQEPIIEDKNENKDIVKQKIQKSQPKSNEPKKDQVVQINKQEQVVKLEENNENKDQNKEESKHMSSLQYALSLLDNGGNVEDFFSDSDDNKSDDNDDIDIGDGDNINSKHKQIKEINEPIPENVEVKSVSTPKQKSNLKKSTSGSSEQRKSVQFEKQIIFEPPKEIKPEELLKEKDHQMKERIAKLDERAKLLGKTEEEEQEEKAPKIVANENIMDKIKPKKSAQTKLQKKQKEEQNDRGCDDEDEEAEEEPKKISKFKQRMMEKKQ